MLTTRLRGLLVVVLFVTAGADWPQFRGGDTLGASGDKAPPVEWSIKPAGESDLGTNVAWRGDLPGRGLSSPIVVHGKVVVTASSGPNQDRLHVLCFDGATGRLDWERQFWATGRCFCHPTSAIAANTPASDGERIFAFFSSNDLVCLDLQGNLRWFRGLTFDFPTAANDVGLASSPLVVGDTVVVQVETKGESFAAGLDTANGATRWQLPRLNQMNWTSPSLLKSTTPGGPDVVLLQSTDRLTAHDPRTGLELWSFERTCSGIPSPVGRGDLVLVASDGLTALRHPPAASTAEVLWNDTKLGPGNASPVLVDNRVYVVSRGGPMTCADARTGEVLWKLRLKGPQWATPVVAGGHLYAASQDGAVQVVRLGKEGEIVAEIPFHEQLFGSPAVADGALYFRSDAHLWKIAQSK